MKKRVLFLVLAALLIMPATAFSANLLGFRIGPSALYNTPMEEIDEFSFEDLEVEDFSFGVDARLNFAVLEGNVLAYFSKASEDVWSVDTLLNAGLSFPVAEILRLGVFAGPRFTFNIGGDDELEEFDWLNYGLNLKGSADFMLGNLGLSVFSIVDTNMNIGDLGEDDFSFGDIFDDPSFSVGASLLFTVF